MGVVVNAEEFNAFFTLAFTKRVNYEVMNTITIKDGETGTWPRVGKEQVP